MSSKILGLILTSVVATTAFAQVENNLSTSVEPEAKKTYQKGFSVGAEYMNITELFMRVRYKGPDRDDSKEYKATGHLGVAGVRIGYTQIPEKGLGGNAGISFLQAFNKSEYINEREQFLVPQFNIHYAFNPHLTVFWGANLSVMTSGESKKIFKPDFGGQLGIGTRFTRNIALNLGYTLLGFRIEEDLDRGVEATGNMYASGFNSNLTYTF